jgi:hypothetical protein
MVVPPIADPEIVRVGSLVMLSVEEVPKSELETRSSEVGEVRT